MTDINSPGSHTDDSILNALKGAGVASLSAWSRLGDLAGEFGRNFKADRNAAPETGAHAFNEDTVPQDHSGLAAQFKAAVNNARAAYQGAQNDRDLRAATTSLAGDADAMFRDFAASVTRAADTARGSAEADRAKEAFGEAVNEVRETFNAAVAQVRTGTKSADIDVEGTIAQMRARLEEVIGRVSTTFNHGPQAQADIIDGDVVDHQEDDR